MGDLSWGNVYFGGIIGGIEKVIFVGVCVVDKSLNIVFYCLVFDNVVNYLGSYFDVEVIMCFWFNEYWNFGYLFLIVVEFG